MKKTVFDFATGETTQLEFTAEELAERNAREVAYVAGADSRKAAEVRAERNAKLSATDWTQTADVPQAVKDSYVSYRQALRDVPQQAGFPNQVVWPESP